MSTRQVRRKMKRFLKEGGAGLAHKGRNRASNRKMPAEIIEKILKLKREIYTDFGPTFFAEKLEEEHGIKIDHETLRRLLIRNDLWRLRRRKSTKRVWREPKHHTGELVQIDGSLHDWFETGQNCTLLAFIDDATKSVELCFAKQETIKSLVDITKNYLNKYGRPMALYSDCGKVFRVNNFLGEGNRPNTQFRRMLNELDIKMIYAYSPQAKGRVERLFDTLQDRLLKEMRLKNIKSIDAANKFLQEEYIEKFNNKFMVKPKNKLDLHRTIDNYNLNSIFCIKEKRTLNNDGTLVYKERWMQVDKKQSVRLPPGIKITVNKQFDGTVSLSVKQHQINFKFIEKEQRTKSKPKDRKVRQRSYKPADNHPWKCGK